MNNQQPKKSENFERPTANTQHPTSNEEQKISNETPPALPNTAQPKKKHKNKTLAVIALILFCLASIVVVIFKIAALDIPEQDTADLILERPEVADEDNAFTYFNAATKRIYAWIKDTDNKYF